MSRGLVHEKGVRGNTNEWYTPKYITDTLGHFDLDPCAAPTTHIADTNYTAIDDGLSKEWFGRVFMNPPYGEKTKIWLQKMSVHNNGIVLIFARTETKMFYDYVWSCATGIFFFKGRIKFISENGIIGPAGAPSVLISYGANNDALINSGLSGKFLPI